MSETLYHVLLCEVDEIYLKRDYKYIKVLSQQLKKRIELHSYLYKGYEELVNHIQNAGRMYDVAVLSIGVDKSQDAYIIHALKQTNVRMPIIKLPIRKSERVWKKRNYAYHLSVENQYSERFRTMFECAMERAECGNNENAYLKLVVNKKRIFLRMDTIIWLEKHQKKICYRTWNNYYEERNTIQNVEERLPDYFLRVSQSAVINMNEISSVEGYTIIMTTEDEFFVGRTYKEKVKMKYMQYAK